jgi:hypothetical protein
MGDIEVKTIKLGVHGIVVELWEIDGDTFNGMISSSLSSPPEPEACIPEWDAAMDAVESMVLGHACAGVDVESPAYIEGLETAIDAIMGNF